jgi:periplasmic protein TonB
MQTNAILSAPLIDLIFDGRNKEYGAYELRKSYSRRIMLALTCTLFAGGLAVTATLLTSNTRNSVRQFNIKPVVELTSIPQTPEPEQQPEPERQPEQPQVKTEIYSPPEIVPDDEFETPPASMEDLKNAQIGLIKTDGVPDSGLVKLKSLDGGKGIIEQPEKTKEQEPLDIVEIDARFSGDWYRFLERNLNANVPVENNAPPGRYSVVLRFVVDTDGSLSNITALTEHGYGMEAETIRVVKKAAKWEPAIQNGHKVKAYRKQVIVFEVLGEE